MTYNNYNHDDYVTVCKKATTPKFNLGDYVIRPNNRVVGSQGLPRKILVDEGFISNTLVQAVLDTYELWKPSKGEWCWFYGACRSFSFGKFLYYSKGGSHLRYESLEGECFNARSCEPFIGKLPAPLKETQ